MAMYTVLRRASAAALPLAFRRSVTLSSPSRSFHSMLSVGIFLRRDTANVAPSLRFANSFATKTSADDSLIHVLESEINCAHDDHQSQRIEIPDDIPFQIEDNPGERTTILETEPYNVRDNIRMKP